MLTQQRNSTVNSAASVSWFGVASTTIIECECESDAKTESETIGRPEALQSQPYHACIAGSVGCDRRQAFEDLG
jgi:hypothetical protein